MDQDAFRSLLASRPSLPRGKQASVDSIPQKPFVATRPPSKPSGPKEPAFKPRKLKKSESRYRDRAAERREGFGNDYAQVEAVLEDMSLLEQNRVRAAASAEDDETLEQAFAFAASTCEPAEPRKRTREEIIRDLKAKRQNGNKSADSPVIVEKSAQEDRLALEAAKMVGRFKPIGFKPFGQTEEKAKKRKVKDGKEGGKKKKQKVESNPAQSRTKPTKETLAHEHNSAEISSSKVPQKSPEPQPAPLDEEFDIFAGAGDYEGFPDDEESEEAYGNREETRAAPTAKEAISPVPAVDTKGWFDEPEPETRHPLGTQGTIPPEESRRVLETRATKDEPQELRLRPLESSALPSIRDFLAMDDAVEKAEKRRARKEKKKKKKAGNDDDD